MIKSFKSKQLQKLHEGKPTKIPQQLQRRTRMLLMILNSATELSDFDTPPGNNLHPLKGKRSNQHAVWINGNYRLVFDWNDGEPTEVDILDYH